VTFSSTRTAAGALAAVPYHFANAEKTIPKEDGKPTVAAIGSRRQPGAFSQGGAVASEPARLAG